MGSKETIIVRLNPLMQCIFLRHKSIEQWWVRENSRIQEITFRFSKLTDVGRNQGNHVPSESGIYEILNKFVSRRIKEKENIRWKFDFKTNIYGYSLSGLWLFSKGQCSAAIQQLWTMPWEFLWWAWKRRGFLVINQPYLSYSVGPSNPSLKQICSSDISATT